MRARPADDATAIALAVALHLGLALLLWLAMRPSEVTQASAGGMAADVVDVGELSSAMQRTLRNRPEPVEAPPLPEPVEDEPEPEPEPQTPPPQSQPQAVLPTPEPVEQEAVVEQPTPVKATETRPQEEKHRQSQADLAAQPDAKEQQQKRLEKEREAQLAEIRRRRAAASREALAAEARLEQLTAPRGGSAAQEAAKSDAAASGGGDDGLLGRYAAALQAAITQKWVRPDNIPSGAVCRLVIRQLPGGEVIDVQVASPCVYDDAGRRSIEAAVLKAQPLPYAGFEKVFSRQLTLNFKAP